MTEPIKLALIGAGSSYAPDLADILITRRDDLPVSEWRLMDINPERLETVGGFLKHMLECANLPTRVTLTDRLDEAVSGVNFAIILNCTRVHSTRNYQ